MKSDSKVGRRNNATLPFRMVYPEKGGRVVTSPHLSPIKRVKTATWSRSVNSEDFLIAEADHGRRLVAIFLEIRLPDASANLASISSANLRRSRM